MIAQFALVVIFTTSAFGCPPGYSTWFNGWCFNVASTKHGDFDNAYEKCELEDARFPVIRSAQENEAFVQEMKAHLNGSMQHVFLGLICNSIGFGAGRLSWEDGTPVNYTNFDNDNACMPDSSYIIDVDGIWRTPRFDFEAKYVTCMTKRPSDPLCDDFETMGGDKQCYKVFDEADLWLGAEETCKTFNSHLVSIHDKDANDFVKRTALANRFMDGIHIGLSYKNGNYSWSDGTSYDFNNFATGYPNEKYGNCVAMQISSLSGQWMNSPCNAKTAVLPFVCSRMIVYEPVQPATCPTTSEFVEGSEIYSPSYPHASGVSACSYFVLVNETKKASVQVMAFESNGCCDTLTIYDGAFGHNIIATLSGSIASGSVFTATGSQMRLAYNATSGNNVKGFHLLVQAF